MAQSRPFELKLRGRTLGNEWNQMQGEKTNFAGSVSSRRKTVKFRVFEAVLGSIVCKFQQSECNGWCME